MSAKNRVYPRNTWVRVNAARALLPGPLRQLRRAPPAQVRAPHHVRSLQVPKGTACRWRCGRCGRADILLQAPPWAGGSTGESTRWRSGRRAPSLRTPLATPRGRACHRSTRLLLASTPYRTPPTSAPAVCIACSCVPLHSGARRPACMQHKQTAHRCRSSRCGQSQPGLSTAQRARGRVAA